jgi:hypothetical protein
MYDIWRLILLGSLIVSGCSGSGGSTEHAADKAGDHVWQAQENAYRKAQDIAPMLNEADLRQRALLEQQGS